MTDQNETPLPAKGVQHAPGVGPDTYVSPNTTTGKRKKDADKIEQQRQAAETEGAK
jgi:hypothetical protein